MQVLPTCASVARRAEATLAQPPAAAPHGPCPRSDGSSIDHYTQFRVGMNVHHSSGLGNHFFYLLSEGGTNRTSGRAITGIGRAKAEKIWYRALTTYMTSGTRFAGARTATLNAARDLHGDGSPEHAAVASAWTACGVN